MGKQWLVRMFAKVSEGRTMTTGLAGPSELVQFDDRKADIKEITSIFFRWTIDTERGPFQVSIGAINSSNPDRRLN